MTDGWSKYNTLLFGKLKDVRELVDNEQINDFREVEAVLSNIITYLLDKDIDKDAGNNVNFAKVVYCLRSIGQCAAAYFLEEAFKAGKLS